MSDDAKSIPSNKDTASPLDWVNTDAGKKKLWMLLIGLCVLTFLIEGFYWVLHLDDQKHGDLFPGAFGALGFGCCTAMIYLAKWAGKWLKVSPDFYGKEDGSADE